MSSKTVLVTLCYTLLIVGKSQNVCFWGRGSSTQLSSTVLNGEYVDSGSTFDGYPYYSYTPPASCGAIGTLFLFASNDVSPTRFIWRIGVGSTGPEFSSIYATCDTGSDNPDPTTACNGYWDVGGGGVDTAVTTTYGACPEWDCDTIKSDWGNSHPCSGPFNEKLSQSNAWKGYSDNFGVDTYFYFHPSYFMFICNNETDYSCDVFAWQLATDRGWTDLSVGNNAVISFKSPVTDHTIQCVADTSQPTDAPSIPTISPTANTNPPTQNPSIPPTKQPSSTPTVSPTRNPSTSPTKQPSTPPTVSPTNQPSYSPTPLPSKSPLPYGITRDPTNNPVNPSRSPTRSPVTSPTNPTQGPTKSPLDDGQTASPTSSPICDLECLLCPNDECQPINTDECQYEQCPTDNSDEIHKMISIVMGTILGIALF